jgi:hypothetical protein
MFPTDPNFHEIASTVKKSRRSDLSTANPATQQPFPITSTTTTNATANGSSVSSSSPALFGTCLQLLQNDLLDELWKGTVDVVSMIPTQSAPIAPIAPIAAARKPPSDKARAARKVEMFLVRFSMCPFFPVPSVRNALNNVLPFWSLRTTWVGAPYVTTVVRTTGQ